MSALTDFHDSYQNAIPMAQLPVVAPQPIDPVMNTSEKVTRTAGIVILVAGLIATVYSPAIPHVIDMNPQTGAYVSFFGSLTGIFVAAIGFTLIDSAYTTFKNRINNVREL